MSGGKLPQIEEEDVYTVTIPIEALASDGGVFIKLAKYILKQNGVVFGAVFNEKYEV